MTTERLMNSRFLVLLLASICLGSGTLIGGTSTVQAQGRDLVYWYHPLGKTCPIFYYEPKTNGDEDRAAKACEQKTKEPYTRASGTAAPAC